VRESKQFAIVITHTGLQRDLLPMDWLETDYRVDESDWIVLSKEGWRAVARGEPSIWRALQRKLLIGHYVSQPDLIAVIGHPRSAATGPARSWQRETELEDVARIVRRVRSILLPPVVMGFWADEDGWLIDIVEPGRPDDQLASTSATPAQGEPAA
jgi:hypothetical protein